MPELERQLMTALRTLYAPLRMEQRQHAAEQQRHSEQIESLAAALRAAQNATLRRRVE